MEVTIGRRFTFEAAHRLMDDAYSLCRNLHGHRYEVTIEFTGQPSLTGKLCDFAELKSCYIRPLEEIFDHARLMSRVESFEGVEKKDRVVMFNCDPTVEAICKEILSRCELLPKPVISGLGFRITKVRVWETENCYAEINKP